jgi:MoaA/NifB/PqqE/SkfB family radical SAM enzyme
MWRDGLALAPSVAAARWLPTTPYKLLLSLTDRCTHRCRACATWTRRPGRELEPAEIDRLLRDLPGLRWLDLTGGEIVARPDFRDVADAVARHAPRLVFLHLATNGAEPAAVFSLVRRLQRAGGPAPVVTVSLDGDEALHDHMRGTPGAFRQAVQTARRLGDLPGVQVYLGTTLTPDNVGALASTRDALAAELPDLVPRHWHVNAMQRSPHFFGNAGARLPDPNALLRALDEVERLRGVPRDPFALAEWTWLRLLRRHLRSGGAPLPCQALRASVFVGPTGDVYPCHLRPDLLGNVRERGLGEVLRGPAAKASRATITGEPCARCFTPCEAYHAILAHPLRALVRAALDDRGAPH